VPQGLSLGVVDDIVGRREKRRDVTGGVGEAKGGKRSKFWHGFHPGFTGLS